MHPIYKNVISNLNLPTELKYKLKYIENSLFLTSNALFQPIITLFPKLEINGDRWIYYSKDRKKLYEINGDRITILEDNTTVDAENVYYVNVGGKIEKIIEKKGECVYNNEKYSRQLIYEDDNILILSNRKKILTFWNGGLLEYDKPKSISFNNNVLSLIYDGYTEVVTNEGHYKIDREAIYLGRVWNKDLVKTLDGKIYIGDTLIGICKEKAELIGYNSSYFVLKCGSTIKYFRENVWKTVNIGKMVYGGFINENFAMFRTETNTLVYSREFTPLYSLNASEDAVANSKYIFLFSNRTFAIIDTTSNDQLIEVEKSKIDFDTPIILRIRKFYIPIFIDMDVINVLGEDKKYVKYYVEPKILGSKECRIKLESPFYTTTEVIRIETKEPQLTIEGEIIRTNGYVLNSDKNAYINLKISGIIQTFLPYEIRVFIRNFIFKYTFTTKRIDEILKIPVNIFDQNLNSEVIQIELVKSNLTQLREEILVPVRYVYPDEDKWKKEVVNPLSDNIIKILYQNNNEISWKRVFVYPTHRKGLIVKPTGKVVNIRDKKIVVRKGIHLVDDYVIIGIDNNLVSQLDVKVDFPYLLISPKIKERYPMEIFYSTHVYRGFPATVIFPIDPAYDKILLRVYVGNDIIEKTFSIPKELFINIALLQAKKIQDYLKSIGIE